MLRKLIIGAVLIPAVWFGTAAMHFPPIFQQMFVGYVLLGLTVFLLLDAPESIHPTVEQAAAAAPEVSPGRATITRETSRELVIAASASEDGFLLLADTFYPGWHAQVDGVATPIYRANVSLRGIALPKGQHTVRFRYEPAPFFRGLWISLAALSVLLVWFGAAAVRRHV